jgi:hypothetical protein
MNFREDFGFAGDFLDDFSLGFWSGGNDGLLFRRIEFEFDMSGKVDLDGGTRGLGFHDGRRSRSRKDVRFGDRFRDRRRSRFLAVPSIALVLAILKVSFGPFHGSRDLCTEHNTRTTIVLDAWSSGRRGDEEIVWTTFLDGS